MALRFVFADESGHQYADTLPTSHAKNKAGGVPGLDAQGNLTGIDGAPVNLDAIAQDLLAQTQDIVNYHVDTYANVAPGSRHRVKCPGGVVPPRPSARTDINFDIYLADVWGDPDMAALGYINMDGRYRMDWQD